VTRLQADGAGRGPWRFDAPGTGRLQHGLVAGTAVVLILVAFVSGRAAGTLHEVDPVRGSLLLVAAVGGLVVLTATLRWPWVAVALVYLTFPVGSRLLPAGAVDLKVVEVAVLLAAGLVALRRLVAGTAPLPWSPPMWWALLFIVAALVATPAALDVSTALKFDGLLVVGLLMALLVPAVCRSIDETRRPLGVLLVVGAGIAVYALRDASTLHASLGGAVVENRPISVFTQPNQFGAFVASLLFVALGLAIGARSRAGRILSAVVALVAFGGLVLSLSRGSWVGTALATALMLGLLPQARRTALSVGLSVLVVGALAFAVLLPSGAPEVQVVGQRLGTFSAPFTSNPYDARPAIWREAMREIQAHPWTGVGPDNFLEASSRAGSYAQAVGAEHAHNTVLNVATEEGVPAAGLLIVFSLAVGVMTVRAVRRLPDPRDRALVGGVGAALFVQLGQGLVDYPLRDPVAAMLMASLVGVVLVAGRELATTAGARA
jgi:putative inorganic carbon (hco3(-)) transporter